MKLRDYLHVNRIFASQLARQLGVHPNHLRLINRGVINPSLELATKIELMTGGQVTVEELRKKEGN